jgi:hypothetical protein
MVQLVLVIIGVSSIHAARLLATSSFRLRVGPVGAAHKVMAIQAHDTVPMTSMNGVFYVRSINPGRWEVLISAGPPYKDLRYDLTIGPGGDADLGYLRLTQ